MFPFCMGRWLENVDNYLWIRNSWGFELSFSDERAASTGFVCLLDGEDSGEAVMLLHKYLKTLEFPPWNYYMWMDSFSLQWKSMKSYPAWLFYYSFSRFILLTVKLRSCFTGLLHTVFFFFFVWHGLCIWQFTVWKGILSVKSGVTGHYYGFVSTNALCIFSQRQL